MARPTKQESQDRRRRLIDAAAARFAGQGFDHTTVADIAADCGIRAPSVLHYFGTKEALFLEVLQVRISDQVLARMGVPVAAEEVSLAGLQAALQAGLEAWRAESRLIAAAFAELIRPGGLGKEVMHDLLTPWLQRFENVVRALVSPNRRDQVPVREIAMMFVFSLAGRMATLDDTPNLWGPEAEVFQVVALLGEALGVASPGRMAP